MSFFNAFKFIFPIAIVDLYVELSLKKASDINFCRNMILSFHLIFTRDISCTTIIHALLPIFTMKFLRHQYPVFLITRNYHFLIADIPTLESLIPGDSLS